MSEFSKREKTFEDKFAHDEGLKFKAHARRNRYLGQWAAEKMGLQGDAAKAYGDEIIKTDLQEPGDEDVFRKLRADFDKAGVAITDHQIRREMDEKLKQAIEEIKAGK
jgi:hypothetical protein